MKPQSPFARKAQAYYRLSAKASRAGQKQASDVYYATAERMMRYADAERKREAIKSKMRPWSYSQGWIR
jgi:hypothetical protein